MWSSLKPLFVILAGVLLFSDLIVAHLTLWDKSLTPLPREQPQPTACDRQMARDLEAARSESLELRGALADERAKRVALEQRCAESEAANVRLKLSLSTVLRNAIFFPERDPALKSGDYIPPPGVPTMPAPFPTPQELGVNP